MGFQFVEKCLVMMSIATEDFNWHEYAPSSIYPPLSENFIAALIIPLLVLENNHYTAVEKSVRADTSSRAA